VILRPEPFRIVWPQLRRIDGIRGIDGQAKERQKSHHAVLIDDQAHLQELVLKPALPDMRHRH
jgi:hypothetical protein